MAAPPIPPRPFDDYDDYTRTQGSSARSSSPPALPPLPVGFRFEQDLETAYPSEPHFEEALAAPRPQKLQPNLPAKMALTLDEQVSARGPEQQRGRSPMPEPDLAPMGFVMPRNRSPLPPPQGSDWSPWAPAQDSAPFQPTFPSGPQSAQYDNSRPNSLYGQRASVGSPPSLSTSFSSLSFSDAPSSFPMPERRSSPPTSGSGVTPALTAPIPTIATLTSAIQSVEQPSFDPARKVAWCRDVLFLVERAQQYTSLTGTTSNDPPIGPSRIEDPELQRLVNVALPLLINISSSQYQSSRPPAHIAEAIYLRATCEATGAFPQFIQQNPRIAFRDFEAAAKAGHHAAWFKLGRDYESFNDSAHARDCFERGVKYGVESCLYRMGMAHLMGQLSLPASPEAALPLLNRAATLATVEVPQPAYVYGLLLLNEFSHITIPPALFGPYIPPGSTPQNEARKHLERAAYLNFAPAQYKLGHAYEFAMPPFPFDALLSVQYYSLASQQGEIEADMALSKWFLCGAEGAFEKDEGLAWTFAEKAANKGLPSAEFAMGYYAEVGVGGPKDIETARKWYSRASQHGNTDATERLQALSQPTPQALSREEHDEITDAKLVRRRTQAKQRSDAAGPAPGVPPPPTQEQGSRIVAAVRKNSLMSAPMPLAAGEAANAGAGAPGAQGMPGAGRGGPRYPGQPGQQPQPLTNSPPGAGAPSRLPPVQEQHRGPSATLPPVQPVAPLQVRPHGAATLPPSQQQQQFAGAARYSLVDPGGATATGPRPPGLPTSIPGRPGMPRHQSRPSASGSPAPVDPSQQQQQQPPRPPPVKGPQTFEEMGFRSQKLEDKECVIM